MIKTKPQDLTGEKGRMVRLLIWNAVDAELAARKHKDKSIYQTGVVNGAIGAICSIADIKEQDVYELVGALADIMQRVGFHERVS